MLASGAQGQWLLGLGQGQVEALEEVLGAFLQGHHGGGCRTQEKSFTVLARFVGEMGDRFGELGGQGSGQGFAGIAQ